MELQGDSLDLPIEESLKATYRALLARGLEVGEAANLTAFLHGLPGTGFQWTLPEIESMVRHRLAYAADVRAAESASPSGVTIRRVRSTIHDRRASGAGFTHVIDPPKP